MNIFICQEKLAYAATKNKPQIFTLKYTPDFYFQLLGYQLVTWPCITIRELGNVRETIFILGSILFFDLVYDLFYDLFYYIYSMINQCLHHHLPFWSINKPSLISFHSQNTHNRSQRRQLSVIVIQFKVQTLLQFIPQIWL